MDLNLQPQVNSSDNLYLRLYNDFNNNIIKQIIVLLILINLFVFFAYNNVFFEIIYDLITISSIFGFISFLEIYYYYYNKFKLLYITIYTIFSNFLITYSFYFMLTNYYSIYKSYVIKHRFLYIYTFDLKGIGICQYKIQTLWIEQITILILMAFLIKYALYILFNLKIFDKSILTHYKFNFLVIFSYLIISGYFTTILYNVNVYFNEELYKQSTYDNIKKMIYIQTSEPILSLDTRYNSLLNFYAVYNKPDNYFTRIINYIYKIPDESN